MSSDELKEKMGDEVEELKAGASGALDRYFGITESGSTIGTEIRAGLTTWLAMAYIIFVNPSILSNAIDVDQAQLVTVTALAAAFGTLLMGLWAKLPFALAPGMGLNAYFTFTVVLGGGMEWETALGAVFISGILFLIISLTGLRKLILDAIPKYLKHAITAGIGLFLAIIGFQAAGLIGDSPATLVQQGDWTSPGVLLSMFGLIVTGVFLIRKMKGAILIGILATTVAAIAFGSEVYFGAEGMVSFPGFGGAPAIVWPSDLIGALDIVGAIEFGIVGVVFTFLFVDFFDTAGTFIGLADKSGRMDADGNIEAPRAAFSADGAATTVGALLGTSSTTTYIESAAGIEDGARTGLASVATGILFLLSMFLAPWSAVVPGVATAPALIIIGAMMMSGAAKVDWSEYRYSVPAFLAIVGMPFTFSITAGISLGLITHTVISALSGKAKEVHPVMYILSALLILRYFTTVFG
jgi:AGZA family xanthine/uracil permease-like MFS transporter